MTDERETKTLGRDSILNAADIKYEDVDTPEWGGKTRVRMLTAKDRFHFEFWCYKNIEREDVIEMHVRICILCIVDKTGNRIFQDEDIDVLMQKNGTVLKRVSEAAMKLNKLSSDDVEEAAKN